jgi:predicted RNA-binding Zn-ribbon protein involved in translation (DUF1610 family)
MNLTSSQKQQLQQLFSNTNDSFFSFLDTYEYEKKHEKLQNAKKEYADYGYDEEPLFLLDDTVFGSADNGFLITDKKIYVNIFLDDEKIFLLSDIDECSYVEEYTISINYTQFTATYMGNSAQQIINIIKKLNKFTKENIIKEKNLDKYLNITIPQSLAINGGEYKDISSGYTIPIKKGLEDGSVLSWDGYGKSYLGVTGKLTVTVNIEKSKPKPKIKSRPISKPKKIVTCINCGKQNKNPSNDDCIFCAKSLTKKEKKKKTELEIQQENDNSIDIDELELIVTCVNCGKDIKNYSSNICPHCHEDVNIKIKKSKPKNSNKISSSSEFYLNVDDEATVKDIKEQFNKQTGLILRVYESSRKQARTNKKLINLVIKKSNIRITTRMKIETIIEKFQEIGVKVKITSYDDSKFCNSNFTLAKAKEKDGEKNENK